MIDKVLVQSSNGGSTVSGASKKLRHLPYLDGLRGIAAIIVMIFHAWVAGILNSPRIPLPFNAFLAVDLFFLMSGYVIARAYGERLETGIMNPWRFMGVRLIRLYPSYFFSVILAVAVMVAIQFSPHPETKAPFFQIAMAGTIVLFFLPSWVSSLPAWSLNGPWWSLFYELIVNSLFAILSSRKKTGWLPWLVGLLWMGLLGLVLHFHSLAGGPGFGLGSFCYGMDRAGYGIFLGCLLYRFQDSPLLQRLTIPPLPCSLAVLFFLLVPWESLPLEVFAITVVFPLSVLSFSSSAPQSPLFSKFLLWLGAISYPIYVIHLPIITLFVSFFHDWFEHCKPWGGFGMIALVILCSDLVNRFIDVPGRKFLTTRFLAPKTPA